MKSKALTVPDDAAKNAEHANHEERERKKLFDQLKEQIGRASCRERV